MIVMVDMVDAIEIVQCPHDTQKYTMLVNRGTAPPMIAMIMDD